MGLYKARAAECRRRAKWNTFMVFLDLAFAVFNYIVAFSGDSVRWLSLWLAVIFTVAMAIMIWLVREDRRLAVKWDDLSRQTANLW